MTPRARLQRPPIPFTRVNGPHGLRCYRRSLMVPQVQRTRFLAVLVTIAAAVALVGCGGSDDEGGETTATLTTETTAGGGNERLSAASWDTYVAARDEAQKVNQAATKTFAKCRDLLTQNVGSEQLQTCFGTTTSEVVTEGEQFMATLASFDDEVGGACATALTDYQGYVKLYLSSVNALVSGLSTTPSEEQVDQAASSVVRARTASAAFEAACKPAA